MLATFLVAISARLFPGISPWNGIYANKMQTLECHQIARIVYLDVREKVMFKESLSMKNWDHSSSEISLFMANSFAENMVRILAWQRIANYFLIHDYTTSCIALMFRTIKWKYCFFFVLFFLCIRSRK